MAIPERRTPITRLTEFIRAIKKSEDPDTDISVLKSAQSVVGQKTDDRVRSSEALAWFLKRHQNRFKILHSTLKKADSTRRSNLGQ